MKNPINETLNEILTKVLSGIDYVSKIALETNKSIPVVYRQLDSLVNLGLLKKERAGKKVAYAINWINFSDLISSAILFDIEKLRKITNAKEHENKLLNEINDLIITLSPTGIFGKNEKLKKIVSTFFKEEKVIDYYYKFLKDLEETGGEFVEYNKLSFNKAIDLFIDLFGMVSKEKQKEVLGEEVFLRNQELLDYCRLRYLQKKIIDPRTSFFD